jgi:hypothetical protein
MHWDDVEEGNMGQNCILKGEVGDIPKRTMNVTMSVEQW